MDEDKNVRIPPTLCKRIAHVHGATRCSTKAAHALSNALGEYAERLCDTAKDCAETRGQVTIQVRDVEFAKKILSQK